ncbi:hypothetical protein H8N03_06755 [Ramlibacter sp. USB13]|uniref:Uncharacterized protein n=1 Tax=Ramlibacter cellulosilyticus TaxID=2764187 RepID=A0A923MQC7_9BURK|nr:hypothetical protein [Ramlibacter cellulosilyticus]MBC5782639.1 hypothetical protein [Ramlibacter cellulosilyticus]
MSTNEVMRREQSRPATLWNMDKVRALSRDERKTLRGNALSQGTEDGRAVADLCDQADAEGAVKRIRTKAGDRREGTRSASLAFDAGVVARVAEKMAALPRAEDVENATQRMWRGEAPATVLADLWQKLVECGFSTREKSEATDPLGLFIAADGPLFHLDQVLAHAADLGPWVDTCMNDSGLWRLKFKRELVEGNLPHFAKAGAPQDPLNTLCRNGQALQLFCDLARGTISDAHLPSSKHFSAGLDPKPFPQIGHKQLRNILVNTGLAVNVVPLDSRWKKFFDGIVTLEDWMFSSKKAYLALEDLLRQALIQIQPKRPDLANLAMVDAIVFATIKGAP